MFEFCFNISNALFSMIKVMIMNKVMIKVMLMIRGAGPGPRPWTRP